MEEDSLQSVIAGLEPQGQRIIEQVWAVFWVRDVHTMYDALRLSQC